MPNGSNGMDTVPGSNRLPKSEADRLALAEQIGADGKQLLTAVF